MTEEQGRIRCANLTCHAEVRGIPFELRIPQRDDTRRLTVYFCSMLCLRDWVMQSDELEEEIGKRRPE